MTTQLSVNLLDPTELAAWRGLLVVHQRVLGGLDEELQASHGLPLAHYEVLLLLADTPDGRLRMTDLATRALLTPSGISRLVDRLAAVGLVVRERCEDDRRGFFACLTEAGRARFAEARPTHLAGIRRRFLAHVEPDERLVLGRVWERVLAADEADADHSSGNTSG